MLFRIFEADGPGSKRVEAETIKGALEEARKWISARRPGERFLFYGAVPIDEDGYVVGLPEFGVGHAPARRH
jgi:hypothetical protein